MTLIFKTVFLLAGLLLPALAARPWVEMLGSRKSWGICFCLGQSWLTMWLFVCGAVAGTLPGRMMNCVFLLMFFLGGWLVNRKRSSRQKAESAGFTRPHFSLVFYLLLLIVFVWAGLLLATAMLRATDDLPATGLWGYKAMVFYKEGQMPIELFLDKARPYLHQSYPLAYPLAMFWAHTWLGEFNDHLVRLFPLLALGFLLWELYAGLRREDIRPGWCLIAVLGLGTGTLGWVSYSMYAEAFLLLAVISAVFCWRQYLQQHDIGAFRLGSWLFAAGAWIKNEGLAVFIFAWIILALLKTYDWRKDGELSRGFMYFLIPAACFILPWWIFRIGLGLAEYDFRFSLSFVCEQGLWEKLEIISLKFTETLWLHPEWHGGVWWLATVLAVSRIKYWRQNAVEQFTALLTLGTLVIFTGILVFSTRDIRWHLGSLPRILLCPAAFAWISVAAALSHLKDEKPGVCKKWNQ